MLAVPVRLLNGQEFTAACHPGDRLAQLRQWLEEQRPGMKRCRLNLRGSFLEDDDALVADLALRPGEFLVGFETRKKKKLATSLPEPLHAAAAAPPHLAPASQMCQTPPGSPRQQWASHVGGGAQHAMQLASPGKLESLLPGYLLRPNPSPTKARVLPVPSSASDTQLASVAAGAEAASVPEQRGGQPAAKRARSLLSLAAEHLGSNGRGSSQAVVPAARQLTQQAEQSSAVGPSAATGQAVTAPGSVEPHLFTDLRAELQGPSLLASQEQEQQACEAADAAAAAVPESASGANSEPALSIPPPQRRTAVPKRGPGSKYKQPSASTEPQQPHRHETPGAMSAPCSAAPAGAAAAADGGGLPLSEAELDAAAAVLPLPQLAQQLEAAFVVLAQMHSFLTTQHIQATWGHVHQSAAGLRLRQPLALEDVRLMSEVCPELLALQQHHRVVRRPHGDSWRLAVSSLQKARAAVATAAAAEAAAGSAGQSLPNPMHLWTDGAGTVLAGAAALPRGSGAASGGTATTAAGAPSQDDTLVIDLADPGKGFLSRPIPAAFLQHLRHQAAAAGTSGTAGRSSASSPAMGIAAASDEELEVLEGSDAQSVVDIEVGGGAQPAAAWEGAAAPPARAKLPVFRINKLVRQCWCFRRALVRALLLLQQQQVVCAPPGVAARAEQMQQQAQRTQLEQQQPGSSAGRHPRRGPGSAAKAGKGTQQGLAGARWHPSFDPDAVTANRLAAAGNQLSAPAQAADAAAQQEATAANALAAARHGRRRQSSFTAAAAAEGVAAAPGVLRAAAKTPRFLKQHASCTDFTEMDIARFLEHLQQLPWYQGQAVHTEQMAARQARHAPPAACLVPAVAAALQLRGVRQLFIHQAAAVDHLLQGRHTVVATSTASGKSLCYAIPILQALAQDRSACALLMFPTKALAQDQLRALRELLTAAFGSGSEGAVPAVEVYDGDTPSAERSAIRNRAQLLITNPDMLHMSVLPIHQQFGRLLANLRYVVVDEGHAYKGVFGCHAALVLRRLRRLCDRAYHSQPTFAVTTATLANPREHAKELLGVSDVEVVGEDGSPHGPRTFVMWNPPLRQPWGRGSESWTEARARNRQERQAQQLHQRQEANQERGKGVLEEQQGVSEAQRLAEAKLRRRRQQLEAAVNVCQQPQPQQEQAEPRLQRNGLQLLARPLQQAGAAARPAAEQQQRRLPQAPRPRLPPELQRDVDRAKTALAAVGGTQSRLPAFPGSSSAGPTWPLIWRQPIGVKAAVEQLPVASTSERRSAGKARGGQSAASSRPAREDGDYLIRLPAGRDWKGQAPQVATPRTEPGAGDSGGRGSPEQESEKEPAEWGEEEENERRCSPIVELSLLLAECMQHGLRTIAFCKSRKLCELVTAYVREILKDAAPHLTGSIAVYRAGYSPAERREIERALMQGNLRAVAATNALELGVDVGTLDCTLHLGFPGSVAALWQQAGRAGRREQACLGVYLGWDGPLDQYFMRHPEQLFGRPIERAMLDACNPSVLETHLACAAAEVPLLMDEDQLYFGAGLPALAAALQSAALLGRHPCAPSPHVLHYIGAVANPATKTSLRAIDPERYAIVDESLGGQLLEEIEESKAFFQVYDGAVYMYQGRTYLCKKLDLDARVAVVRPADVKYYTKCIDCTDVHVQGGCPAFAPPAQPTAAVAAAAAARVVQGGEGWQPSGGGPGAVCSQATVTVRWLGFRRIWRGTGQVFDTVDLFLPDVHFETEAAYCRLPHTTRQRLREAGLPFRDGVHAACHALLNVLPLYLMCNPTDVGTECDHPYDTRFKPERILIFDKHPGGIGLAAGAALLFPELLRHALELVRECGCSGRSGCPACVQHTDCSEYNALLNKKAAVVVLESLLEGQGEEPRAGQKEGQKDLASPQLLTGASL